MDLFLFLVEYVPPSRRDVHHLEAASEYDWIKSSQKPLATEALRKSEGEQYRKSNQDARGNGFTKVVKAGENVGRGVWLGALPYLTAPPVGKPGGKCR